MAEQKENDNKKIKYEEIKEAENIKKTFPKKCCSFMSNFNKEKDLSADNSNIKYNQISVIEKYGILYFFNEEGVYFLDNSKMKELITDYKDLSYSELFYLKCYNIYKIFSLEEGEKAFLVICTQKDPNNKDSNSFLIYIDIEELIEKINNQKIIYDKKMMAEIEFKEEFFKSGLASRELDELDRNLELNEDGEYDEYQELYLNPKKLTEEEKIMKFLEEKKEKCDERDEIFRNSYENAVKFKPFKIIYIENIFKDVILLDLNNYIILYENGDIIFYNNYEIIRLLQNNAKLISYNKDTSIFLIIAHDYIYILKENNNFESLKEIKKFPIKEILSEEGKFNLIFCENIFNYVILYTIENNPEPEKDDRLYFIELNENMEEIINIYKDGSYFIPDDYYLSGISFYSQLKRTIFSLYDEDLGIYMIFNKHMEKLNKYYYFEANQDNKKIYDLYEISIADEYQLNGIIEKSDDNENKGKFDELIENEEDEYMNKLKDNNAIIGVTLIKFQFDGYDEENEMVEKEMIKSPYLIFLLGFYGGFKVFYASSFNQKSLKEKSESFSKLKNISNKVLEISINEEMAKIEREKYLNENIKKEKNFTELNKLKKLNQRNIFLHELDQQIKDNIKYFKSLAISDKIEFQLRELNKLADSPNINIIQESIKNLMKEAKELFIEEEENQKFIDDNKKIIENIKNEEINIKNHIKIIEDNKKKTKGLKMNVNTPINELLTHPKIKNFFTEEKVTKMMNIFNKIKKYYNLYENHIHLISELFIINNDLIKQIEECRKKYNSIQDSCKYSQNWKEINGMKAKLQNNIFILYMRVFEQFFFNLEKYENNNLNKEYLYLTQLKNNFQPVKKLKNQEEEKEIIHRNHARFDLRDEEEDIDEGNNDSLSSEELEKNIISASSLKKNKIIEFNNYNRINNNEIEQQSVIAKNDINANINNNNNDYIVNKDAKDTINKIFGVNLVKEKEGSKKNYLIDVLSNFEGRITIYNKETEENYCTDAEELFQEFLLNEEEIKKKEIKRQKNERNKRKKEKRYIARIRRFSKKNK
jgi:hypothetical protein